MARSERLYARSDVMRLRDLSAVPDIPDARGKAALCLNPRVLVVRPAAKVCYQSVRNMLPS